MDLAMRTTILLIVPLLAGLVGCGKAPESPPLGEVADYLAPLHDLEGWANTGGARTS